jgi:hypothetical protein
LDIFLDLSYCPDSLLSSIINSDNIKNLLIKKDYSKGDQATGQKGIEFDFPGPINELELLLNSILQKNSNKEYVVVQDTEQDNTLTLLKKGDVEQLGIFICDLCGAVFHDEDEKYEHQRAHFLF